MARPDPAPSSSASSTSSQKDDRPYFFPALALQRRVFCREVIKREGVRSVVELGCGEGSLLADLCQPAPHLDDFPPFLPPPLTDHSRTPSSEGSNSNGHNASGFTLSSLSSAGNSPAVERHEREEDFEEEEGEEGRVHDPDNDSRLAFLRDVPQPNVYEKNLHCERLYGLDIRDDSLSLAARSTAPSSSHPSDPSDANPWTRSDPDRWRALRLELWQGSLDRYNEAFDSAECIVASEVIEHLSDSTLKKFAPVVLGKYNARVVVVTTPNYDFNQYFARPKPKPSSAGRAAEEDKHRFPDPTGRTDRVFRDEDHKFEWTQQEFEDWATKAAAENDFEVEFTGCGSYANYFGRISMTSSSSPPPSSSSPLAPSADAPPPPKDPRTFYATQCAIFRRRFRNDLERSPRSPRPSVLPFLSSSHHSNKSTLNGPSPSASSSSALGTGSSPHRLHTLHEHKAHPRSGKSKSPGKILERLEKVLLEEWGTGEAGLGSLWGWSGELRADAGGEVRRVVEAVALHGNGNGRGKEKRSGKGKGKVKGEEGPWKVEVREGRGVDAVWIICRKPLPPPATASGLPEDVADLSVGSDDEDMRPAAEAQAEGGEGAEAEGEEMQTPLVRPLPASGWPTERREPERTGSGWGSWE